MTDSKRPAFSSRATIYLLTDCHLTDMLQVNSVYRYLCVYVVALSFRESWDVNRHTARCTSYVMGRIRGLAV